MFVHYTIRHLQELFDLIYFFQLIDSFGSNIFLSDFTYPKLNWISFFDCDKGWKFKIRKFNRNFFHVMKIKSYGIKLCRMNRWKRENIFLNGMFLISGYEKNTRKNCAFFNLKCSTFTLSIRGIAEIKNSYWDWMRFRFIIWLDISLQRTTLFQRKIK